MAGVNHLMLVAGGYVPMEATGGVITEVVIANRKYKVHTFASSGSFTITEAGTDLGQITRMMVAGGGGGGDTTNKPVGACGGGGAGDLNRADMALAEGSYAVVVGLGGAPMYGGGSSQFNGQTVQGGGSGGIYAGGVGQPGGSGGGAGQSGTGGTTLGGAATGVGYRGGNCVIPPSKSTGGGGGGGGMGGLGGDAWGAISVFNGGNGGAGVADSIDGFSRLYCGGGGGAGSNASAGSGTGQGTNGVGGSGIGGNGARYPSYAATLPVQNTGSGGGGGNGNTSPPTSGAHGIVKIRYPIEAEL